MQKHWDVMRTDDAGDNWTEVSGNLPTDFGFPIDVHAHEPETIYVVPIKSDCEHYPPEGKLRVYRSKTGGNEWEAADQGPAAEGLLRQRPARRDGRRSARQLRRLLRHHRRPGLLLAGRRRQLGSRSCATCRRCCRWRCRRCSEAATKRRIGTREARYMKYMLLCYDDAEAWERAGEDALREAMQEAVRLTHELHARGQYVMAAPLEPASTSKSVRVRDGRSHVTDGPFAEAGGARRVLRDRRGQPRGGDRHRRASPAARVGTVEVRPLMEIEGLPGGP